MAHITTLSSFRSAVGVRTFNHLNHTYSEEPTNARQNCSPLVPNHYSDSLPQRDPLHHARVVPVPSISIAESAFYALYFPRDMSIPSLSSYLNSPLDESTANNTVPALGFPSGEPPYNILFADQLHLHQADETTPEPLPAPAPSGLPYSSASLTTRHPQNLLEPTNLPLDATSAFDQTQIHVETHLPSTSTTFHWFGGNSAALSAPPVPLATASPITDHSNTVYICQCITDGSPCNAVVSGSIRSVRDHLNQVHEFRGAGKDKMECLWAGCEKSLQRENIPRHIVTRHLRVKVSCVDCGLPLSRRDVQYSHAKACHAKRRTASRFNSEASSPDATLTI